MTARSYSQISLYEKCPTQFNLRHNEKLDMGGVKSPQAARGTIIHESIEVYLKGSDVLPNPEIKNYHGWLKGLKEDGAKSEIAFCFNDLWESVPWNDKTGYIRGYIDGLLEDKDGLCIFEFKTGNEYDDHVFQRQIYGIAALVLFPKYDEVEVIGIYFDKGKEVSETLYRSRLATYKYLWTERIDRLNTDPYFAARPGPHCNWCDYAKKRGGPCRFGA